MGNCHGACRELHQNANDDKKDESLFQATPILADSSDNISPMPNSNIEDEASLAEKSGSEEVNCTDDSTLYKELRESFGKMPPSEDVALLEGVISRLQEPNKEDLGTVLQLAIAAECAAEVAKLLIEAGADVNSSDAEASSSLHHAAINNMIEVVELLLSKDVELECVNGDGVTPLVAAIQEGNEGVAKLLLDKGANKDSLAKSLIEACQLCEVEHCAGLLRCKADPNAKASDGGTPLTIAVDRGISQIVSCLVEFRADVNIAAGDGFTPLHIAAQKNYCELAECLLQNGAVHSMATITDTTALLIAARNCSVNMVKVLSDAGAKLRLDQKKGLEKELGIAVAQNDLAKVRCLLECGLNSKNKKHDGKSLIALALEKNHKQMISLLAEKGLDQKDKNSLGKKLTMACSAGKMEDVKFYLSVGASMEIKNQNGSTSFLIAVEKQNKSLITLLLEQKADSSIANSSGKTALSIASEKGNFEVIRLLTKAGLFFSASEMSGANEKVLIVASSGNEGQLSLLLDCKGSADSKDISGETALHKAAANGHVKVVGLLLDRKANIQPQGGEYGTTPLYYACNNKRIDVAKLLVERGASAKNTDPEGDEKFQALLAQDKKGKRMSG